MKKMLFAFMMLMNINLLSAAAPAQNQVSQGIIQLDGSSFKQVISGSRPVVIDVYADWCGPCKQLAPVLQELSQELGNEVVFAKVNSDQQSALSNSLNVHSLPTLIFFKNGKEVGRSTGYMSKAQLNGTIKQYFK